MGGVEAAAAPAAGASGSRTAATAKVRPAAWQLSMCSATGGCCGPRSGTSRAARSGLHGSVTSTGAASKRAVRQSSAGLQPATNTKPMAAHTTTADGL
jgi:hypothetical protein